MAFLIFLHLFKQQHHARRHAHLRDFLIAVALCFLQNPLNIIPTGENKSRYASRTSDRRIIISAGPGLADGFSGEFHGSATLSFPNLVDQVGELIGIESSSDLFDIELASVSGQITESGCISIYVATLDTDAQFALTPGGCNPAITVEGSNVVEGNAAEVTFVIHQLPDDASGTARVKYRIVDGEGTAAATADDYSVPGQQVDINLAAITTNEFGVNSAEASIFIPTVADANLEPDEYFTVEVESVSIVDYDMILLEPSARVTIIDNDEPANPNWRCGH